VHHQQHQLVSLVDNHRPNQLVTHRHSPADNLVENLLRSQVRSRLLNRLHCLLRSHLFSPRAPLLNRVHFQPVLLLSRVVSPLTFHLLSLLLVRHCRLLNPLIDHLANRAPSQVLVLQSSPRDTLHPNQVISPLENLPLSLRRSLQANLLVNPLPSPRDNHLSSPLLVRRLSHHFIRQVSRRFSLRVDRALNHPDYPVDNPLDNQLDDRVLNLLRYLLLSLREFRALNRLDVHPPSPHRHRQFPRVSPRRFRLIFRAVSHRIDLVPSRFSNLLASLQDNRVINPLDHHLLSLQPSLLLNQLANHLVSRVVNRL
jgi:hypothetical protein